jgi:hypothetical protein
MRLANEPEEFVKLLQVVLDLLYVTASGGTNVLLSSVCRMFITCVQLGI